MNTFENDVIKDIKSNAKDYMLLLDNILLAYTRDNNLAIAYTEASFTSIRDIKQWLVDVVSNKKTKKVLTKDDLYNTVWSRREKEYIGDYNGVPVYSNHFVVTNIEDDQSCVYLDIVKKAIYSFYKFDIHNYLIDYYNICPPKNLITFMDVTTKHVSSIKGLPIGRPFKGNVVIFDSLGNRIACFDVKE